METSPKFMTNKIRFNDNTEVMKTSNLPTVLQLYSSVQMNTGCGNESDVILFCTQVEYSVVEFFPRELEKELTADEKLFLFLSNKRLTQSQRC